MTCAIYIRKSREEKNKTSHRLTFQREQLPAYAKAQGWQYEIYDDGHTSAARGKTENLKERARLEADIRSGKINIILCIEFSRLSRDDTNQDFSAWLAICRDHNIKLATPGQIIDPSQIDHWVLSSITGILSAAEMQQMTKRMKDGRDEAWRAGKWLGGTPPPPYTYDHENSRPVIDPDQLPQMQQLWTMAETMSAKAIAEQLNMPEIAVRRAISDERLLTYQAKRLDTANLEAIPCDWQPCMTADQALRIRAGRRSRKNLHGKKAAYSSLLSAMGLLYCGYCGGLYKTWQGRVSRETQERKDYYGCGKKNGKTCPESRMIQQTEFNRLVAENMLNTLENIDKLKQHWLESNNSDPATELTELAKQERATNQKKQRLISAITEGIVELAEARPQMQQINDTLTAITTAREQIVNNSNTQPDWESISITRREFSALDANEQRNIIKAAIQRIDIYNSYAIITYPFPRSSSGSCTARINLPPRKK